MGVQIPPVKRIVFMTFQAGHEHIPQCIRSATASALNVGKIRVEPGDAPRAPLALNRVLALASRALKGILAKFRHLRTIKANFRSAPWH